MSGRRGGNRIRGPQSALTDFLAANNISAAQIRDDYDRRLRESDQQVNANGQGSSTAAATVPGAAGEAEQENESEQEAAQAVIENARKRKRQTEAAAAKIKNAKKKKKSGKKHDGNTDSEWDDMDVLQKARPMPGQFEHCEICSKRFTVTPYSKEGPDGGLLCTPCGKQLVKDVKAQEKASKPKKPLGKKRRQNESNRLDGLIANRVKSLQHLCIDTVVKHHDQVSELGDIPPALLDKLGAIFSKKRVLNSNTLRLFVRPDLETVAIHDAAYLEVDDYIRMFGEASGMSKLVLRNACQLKDSVIEYMLEKCDNIKHLQLYAANLVSDEMWVKLFQRYGKQLHTIQLSWLDASFDDKIVAAMVQHCPNLQRLKLKLLRRIGEESILSISKLQHLEHLSLHVTQEVTPEALIKLITNVGWKLKTLSFDHFLDLDDAVIAAIHDKCRNLSKLRISDNDTAADTAYAQLFDQGWKNPPLRFIDFNSTRHMDNNDPKGPAEAVGLADRGFAKLMKHSGLELVHLDVASCRHISLKTFNDVFDGQTTYPSLETINLSFCSCVDTRTVAGIFKSCPSLKKVIAFGCFDVLDVVVPRDVVLIGVPKAQDAIEQVGMGMGVDEALLRMQEVEATA